MEPKLSVIVPAYNVAEYLPDCLDSILASTLHELEVIVIDDGSPDELGEIADKYAERDSRVRVMHIENVGLGPARNLGASVARGEYLMFIDSDDLVTSRAFELMVTCLDRTGSDFAAANAWRYTPSKGVTPSWTHRQAFAQDRFKTNIHEFPLLIRDRMAWNKMWRRSFWEKTELAYPAMRYEDYPVTIAAYLAAESVDILSERIYYWRQRESNTSITQRSTDLDNVADRVKSAEMVLDLADRSGNEDIINALHAYLIDVDLVTVAEAVANSAPEDLQQMEALFARLVNRLQPQKSGATRLARLIHKVGRKGDLDTVKVMASWRSSGDRQALVKSLLKPAKVAVLPPVMRAVTPKRSKALAIRNRNLRGSLVEARADESTISLEMRVKLRSSMMQRATVKVELVTDADTFEVPASVAFDAEPGALIKIQVPVKETANWLTNEAAWLRVSITVGVLTWVGALPADVKDLPAPIQLASDSASYLVTGQFFPGSPRVCFKREHRMIVSDVSLSSEGLTVDTRDAQRRGYVALARTAPSAPVVKELISGKAVFPWNEVIANDPADDPSKGTSYRPIVFSATRDINPHWMLEEHLQAVLALKDLEEWSVSDAVRNAKEPWPIYSETSAEFFDSDTHRFSLYRRRNGATDLVIQGLDYVVD